jgi:hypothetical protein
MGTYVLVVELPQYQIWDGAVARPRHGEKATIGHRLQSIDACVRASSREPVEDAGFI